MSDKRAYVFEFYPTAASPEPAFSRTLPFGDDDTAIQEGALFLRNQQTLAQPAAAIVISREEGGALRSLGRWVWEGAPRWTRW